MLKLLVLALVFWLQAEEDNSQENSISHAAVVDILTEASQIKVPDVKQIRDSKDTDSIQPAAPPPPPPPNLPEPPAF